MLNTRKFSQTLVVLVFNLFANSVVIADQISPKKYHPKILKFPGESAGIWYAGSSNLPPKSYGGIPPGLCLEKQMSLHNGDSKCTIWPVETSGDDTFLTQYCPYDVYCDGRKAAGFSYWIKYSCPDNYVSNSSATNSGEACVLAESPKKDIGDPGCPNGQGNPINSGNGNKYQQEHDYKSDGAYPLQYIRRYNSSIFPSNASNVSSGLWKSFFQKKITAINFGNTDGLQITGVVIERDDGSERFFTKINGIWEGDSDTPEKLIEGNSSDAKWLYKNVNDEVEVYNASGQLISITNRQGYAQNLTYDLVGNLNSVTDSFGRSLSFSRQMMTHDFVDLEVMTDPAGQKYSYVYDMPGRLKSVIFPDGKVRNYVYHPDAISLLVGIIDENGAQFATWKYAFDQSAISSEHSNGVDKVTLAYSGNTTTITDANGTTRSREFLNILGKKRLISQSQPAGSGCAASISNLTYDANGNIASKTDFNGKIASYEYDLNRNLETKRVEASGTPQARTTSTSWHATYRLPLQIHEPLLRTTFVYDDKGNLLSKTEQATTDSNGSQGTAAVAVGSPRTTKYTYNTYGQVLTVTGPRTDVADVTTYTYDEQGNLTSVTNAAGHVTSYSNYDPHGHVGTITDPNGLVTTLTYAPRGWLTSRTTTGDGVTETTSYTYDGVGQMTQVALPDGNQVHYTYDDAHRLTKITDNLGNSINYTLDSMGNRINETVVDASGNLIRRVTRIYDALNRLQQVTGGAQ